MFRNALLYIDVHPTTVVELPSSAVTLRFGFMWEKNETKAIRGNLKAT